MSKTYVLRLDDHDVGQLLDGLEARAAAWTKTADLESGLLKRPKAAPATFEELSRFP